MDTYTYCESKRISPEAPVPIVIPKDVINIPGGAGNVAMNLSKLGAQVTCVGCVGGDHLGLDLINHLNKNNINTEHIHSVGVNTTSKNRYFSNGKQLMRLDLEEIYDNWQPPDLSNFANSNYDVIILSDYNKGVLNNKWFTNLKAKNIIVDPKKDDFSFYKNADIITPNLNELQRVSNSKIKTEKRLNNLSDKISLATLKTK